jgi:hypothetical protein
MFHSSNPFSDVAYRLRCELFVEHNLESSERSHPEGYATNATWLVENRASDYNAPLLKTHRKPSLLIADDCGLKMAFVLTGLLLNDLAETR